MEICFSSDLLRPVFGIRADLKHNPFLVGVVYCWVWVLDVIGHGINAFTRWPALLHACHDSHHCDHTDTEQSGCRDCGSVMWNVDRVCRGLVLTTEQGSVFVQGSHLAFLVYWHTVCSRASLSHRRAVSMGETCGKANSTGLFFGGLVESSCLKVGFLYLTAVNRVAGIRWHGSLQCGYKYNGSGRMSIICNADLCFYWLCGPSFRAYVCSTDQYNIACVSTWEPTIALHSYLFWFISNCYNKFYLIWSY